MAGLRNGVEASRLATQASESSKRQNAAMLDTLAAAYAEAGRFDNTIKTTGEIRDLTLSSHDTAMADTTQQRMELYQTGRPYRDEPCYSRDRGE